MSISPSIFVDGHLSENWCSELTDCSDCIGYYPNNPDLVTLNSFPIDLDLLFWSDQPEIRAQRLNAIGNGTWGWMLTPWGGHFISSHFEGADKWYFYADRPLNITAPISGKVQQYRVSDGSSAIVNGNPVIVDVRLVIDIGSGCSVKFEHLTILESLHDQVKDGNYKFTLDEFLGYPTEWSPGFWTIDFHYWYKSEDICPYPALSQSLQEQLTTLYNLQYARAKIGGVYPQSTLCNDMNISIRDSFWGVWEYKTGPYDSFMTDVDRIFGYEVGGFTFLNRELTNPQTFHRDMINLSKELSPDIIGVFRDAGNGDVPGYDSLGTCMVEQVEGDNLEGILELIIIDSWDWGDTASVYTRYSLDTKTSKLGDDLLTIEYFSTLSEAQDGFTENSIIYQRFLGFLSFQDGILIITLSAAGLVVLIISVVLTITFVKKKKKRMQK